MTTLYYLLMLKASRNGYISPADVTNPNFMPETIGKDDGNKRDASQDRPRSRSESAAKKEIGQRNPSETYDARITDRRESSNTPSRIAEKRPSIKPEARRPTNPQVGTAGSSATGANLNNSMFNVPNPVIVKPTTDYSTKSQVVPNRTSATDSKAKRTNVQRMNTSGMDDSTQAVNRSTNASQSPVPRRPEQDSSQLGTNTDASGYKNRNDDESINKKILRNKLKEIEDASYAQKDKKSSVEPVVLTRLYSEGLRKINSIDNQIK